MPNGLDYSFVLPQINGTPNQAYEHSNNASTDNLQVASSKIMHVNSNLDLTKIDPNPSPQTQRPICKLKYVWMLRTFSWNDFQQLRESKLPKITKPFRMSFRKKSLSRWTFSAQSTASRQSMYGGCTTTVDWLFYCLTSSQHELLGPIVR